MVWPTRIGATPLVKAPSSLNPGSYFSGLQKNLRGVGQHFTKILRGVFKKIKNRAFRRGQKFCEGVSLFLSEPAGSTCAAIADERDVSGSDFAPRIQRRSTGSDCRSHDCPPKYCLCGSNRRTSYTGSPSKYYLCPCRSPRTTKPPRSPRALD